MIDLYNATTNQFIGSVSEADLQVLIDVLEEESSDDTDYYINEETLDLLAEGGASPQLVSLLRTVVAAGTDGAEIRWQRR
jgi:hypothetical protein